jgi:hypothetical protein
MVEKVQTRGQRRLAAIVEERERTRPSRIRVLPKNDELRKTLRHASGIAFPAEGSVEWPNDTFTQRRIRDGDVTVEQVIPQSAEQRMAPPKDQKPSGQS